MRMPFLPSRVVAQVSKQFLPLDHAVETSVLISQTVTKPTESALCHHFRVVHAMPDGLECPQVGEYVFEVAIAQTPIIPPGHDRLEFTCLHISGTHCLHE